MLSTGFHIRLKASVFGVSEAAKCETFAASRNYKGIIIDEAFAQKPGGKCVLRTLVASPKFAISPTL